MYTKNINQTILTEQYPNKEVDELFKLNQNKTYLIHVSERDLILGLEIKYKRVLREYKLLNVDGLREIAMKNIKNKIQYKKDKKNWERIEKQGNGYG